MGSPLGAAKYNSLLQGAASLDRLGTTALNTQKPVYKIWGVCGEYMGAVLICGYESSFRVKYEPS